MTGCQMIGSGILLIDSISRFVIVAIVTGNRTMKSKIMEDTMYHRYDNALLVVNEAIERNVLVKKIEGYLTLHSGEKEVPECSYRYDGSTYDRRIAGLASLEFLKQREYKNLWYKIVLDDPLCLVRRNIARIFVNSPSDLDLRTRYSGGLLLHMYDTATSIIREAIEKNIEVQGFDSFTMKGIGVRPHMEFDFDTPEILRDCTSMGNENLRYLETLKEKGFWYEIYLNDLKGIVRQNDRKNFINTICDLNYGSKLIGGVVYHSVESAREVIQDAIELDIQIFGIHVYKLSGRHVRFCIENGFSSSYNFTENRLGGEEALEFLTKFNGKDYRFQIVLEDIIGKVKKNDVRNFVNTAADSDYNIRLFIS